MVVSTVWHAFCYVRNLTPFNGTSYYIVSRGTLSYTHRAATCLHTRLIVSRGTLLMKVKHPKMFGRLKNSPYLCNVKQ